MGTSLDRGVVAVVAVVTGRVSDDTTLSFTILEAERMEEPSASPRAFVLRRFFIISCSFDVNEPSECTFACGVMVADIRWRGVEGGL